MKKGLITIAILSGIGIFGYSIYNFYKKQADLLKQFKWKIIDFNLTDWSEDLIKGVISFRFESISDVEITINEFYLDLYFNGKKVGYIQDVSKFIIPAKGYNDIPFEFTLDPQFIIKGLVDIVAYATKQKDATITLDGYVNLKSGFIGATVPIKCNCSVANLDCNC